MKILNIIILITCTTAMLSCSNRPEKDAEPEDETPEKTTCTSLLPEKDTLIELDGIETIIKIVAPKDKKGTFLLLHGWNLPASDWCSQTSLCDSALSAGYCVVLPNLGKSNYQLRTYPETRSDYASTPGLLWLTDTLIPHLQSMCLLVQGERNFIVGLSTGGRGVVLVCEQLPGLFTGAAALSGDYEQSQMQHDKVHIGFWGSYEIFPERWTTDENPVHRIKEMKTPIYIGHGRNDKVTNFIQSQMLSDSLKKHHPTLKTQLHLSEAGHDYEYWGSEVANIMKFFREIE
jgi:dienelactone hydrolase